MPCRRSKLRCDQAVPTCSRCTHHAVQCSYEKETAINSWQPYQSTPRSSQRFATEFQQLEEILGESATFGDSSALLGDLDTDFSGESTINPRDTLQLDWATPDFNMNTLDGSKTPSPIFSALPYTSSTNSGSNISKETSTFTSTSVADPLENTTDDPLPWLRPVSSTTDCCAPTRTLERNPSRQMLKPRSVLQHCALSSVLVGQLTSYPKMMFEGGSLPPFIHPPCYLEEALAPDCIERQRHQCLPRELAICSSLVEMFHSATPATTGYVWKTIYAEGDRIKREVSVCASHRNYFQDGC